MHVHITFEKLSFVFYFAVCAVLHVETRHIRNSARDTCRGSEIDIMTSRGVRIEPMTLSRVQLPQLSKTFSSDGHKLEFEFKTNASTGLLFYGKQPHHARNRMILLQLAHGKLFFTIRCPAADVELRLPVSRRVNDNEWHKIGFQRRGRKGYITLDGKAYFKRYPATCKLTSFVFGGVDSRDTNVVTPILRGNGRHFEGCMRNLKLNVHMNSPPDYFAVSTCS